MQAGATTLTKPLDRPEWLPHEEWPFEPRVLEVDDHRIHLIDEGDGPVLLFVHAGLWSFIWRDVILRLRHRFRCIALDFPDSGLSTGAPDFRPSLLNHSRVLEQVADALSLKDITLVVHDLGGPVGLAFAIRRPELIRGLVVARSFAWPPRFLLQGMLKLMGGSVVRGVMTRTNLLMRATSSRFGVGRRLGTGGRRAFLGPMDDRSRRATIHLLMRDTSRYRSLLGEIKRGLETSLSRQPFLMIIGKRNDPIRYYEKRWESLFPDASRTIMGNGYHFPMCDDPDLFASSIASWSTY